MPSSDERSDDVPKHSVRSSGSSRLLSQLVAESFEFGERDREEERFHEREIEREFSKSLKKEETRRQQRRRRLRKPRHNRGQLLPPLSSSLATTSHSDRGRGRPRERRRGRGGEWTMKKSSRHFEEEKQPKTWLMSVGGREDYSNDSDDEEHRDYKRRRGGSGRRDKVRSSLSRTTISSFIDRSSFKPQPQTLHELFAQKEDIKIERSSVKKEEDIISDKDLMVTSKEVKVKEEKTQEDEKIKWVDLVDYGKSEQLTQQIKTITLKSKKTSKIKIKLEKIGTFANLLKSKTLSAIHFNTFGLLSFLPVFSGSSDEEMMEKQSQENKRKKYRNFLKLLLDSGVSCVDEEDSSEKSLQVKYTIKNGNSIWLKSVSSLCVFRLFEQMKNLEHFWILESLRNCIFLSLTCDILVVYICYSDLMNLKSSCELDNIFDLLKISENLKNLIFFNNTCLSSSSLIKKIKYLNERKTRRCRVVFIVENDLRKVRKMTRFQYRKIQKIIEMNLSQSEKTTSGRRSRRRRRTTKYSKSESGGSKECLSYFFKETNRDILKKFQFGNRHLQMPSPGVSPSTPMVYILENDSEKRVVEINDLRFQLMELRKLIEYEKKEFEYLKYMKQLKRYQRDVDKSKSKKFQQISKSGGINQTDWLLYCNQVWNVLIQSTILKQYVSRVRL